MKKFKVLFMIVLLGVFVSKTLAFDTDFSFMPASGTKMKLYCEYPVYMIIDGGSEKFNGFEASISFDSHDIVVKTGPIHSEFPNGNNYINGDLYNIGGAMAGGYKEGILTGVSFKIITKKNIASTILSFVDKNGSTPSYGLETTDDGITLNGVDQGLKDILSDVKSVSYNFVALPCVADGDQPRIEKVSVNNGANKVPENTIIKFLTYDWNGGKKVSYWFSGNSVDNINNYVPVPILNNVDNQEGVDSGSISVKISCITCSSSKSDISATLLISDWEGSGDSINALTWDSEIRGYNVSITPPFDYEVEKLVTGQISVTDNPNENGETHTRLYDFYFNAPVAPTINRVYPSINTFVSPSKSFAISFNVSDAWAGIDTGSVKITIPQIMSGNEILFPGYIYSGSDLDFELIGGSEGLGNGGDYLVSFYPKEDFPVSTEIVMNVEGSDLAGTSKIITSKFTTRPGCSYFGCVDSLNVIGDNFNQIFSGIVLTVTGTNPNSPYPYLTGENGEILMCGGGWDGINFDGNVTILDDEGNNVGENLYVNNELFITGLDFVYKNGVIIVQ